jgi:hypothetical protein
MSGLYALREGENCCLKRRQIYVLYFEVKLRYHYNIRGMHLLHPCLEKPQVASGRIRVIVFKAIRNYLPHWDFWLRCCASGKGRREPHTKCPTISSQSELVHWSVYHNHNLYCITILRSLLLKIKAITRSRSKMSEKEDKEGRSTNCPYIPYTEQSYSEPDYC